MDTREIIQSQRHERDRLLANTYVEREGLSSLKAALGHDLIKVITGPRRAGKSVFAIEALKGADFAYLNFDDERLLAIREYDDILKGILQVYGQTRTLFFDEIQNLPQWELFLNRLQREGYNLVITGSNSRLLSKELGTHLTGRFLQFDILPFSFREVLKVRGYDPAEKPETRRKQGELLALLSDYLHGGGYPEVVVKGVEYREYLKMIFNSTLMRDIVRRYRVRAADDLNNIGIYLIANHSASVSMNGVKDALGLKSTTTVEKYVRYLSEAFLLFMVDRFSFKMKERVRSQKKVYTQDTGMIDAVTSQFSQNLGRKMENVVAIELLRRRSGEIFYYRAADRTEVDFVVKDGLRVSELIQVCYNLADRRTRTREIAALGKAASEINCDRNTIITWDEQGSAMHRGHSINLVPLSDWLLNR